MTDHKDGVNRHEILAATARPRVQILNDDRSSPSNNIPSALLPPEVGRHSAVVLIEGVSPTY